ncbi:MAG: LLM class flavin-dependent oxidoreductase [Acidimicrobiia bacterium]|nr:LLM class flavin-dependent oxidoreductase [Acidimicrobiia bacterium]
MDFNLFIYCTVGRRAELEAGMAGRRTDLYQRMLGEIADFARLADERGYAGFGHPEHHLQIEGFEASNELGPMAMWLGMHTKRLRVISCGWVSTAHNPLRSAEYISTIDNMLRGRFGFGMVRGYQARWVENFKIRDDLAAVGPWNKNTPEDDYNRDYFTEFVEVVLKALTSDTFNHQGRFWQFPPPGMVNPHVHRAYSDYGAGVREDMTIDEIGIAPRPFSQPHPQLYGGFSASLRTALFWARYKGRPIVLADDLDFCQMLWSRYAEEAARHGHDVTDGSQAAWGGLMVCAPTDAEAHALAEDMNWMWETWSIPFGNGFPTPLIGSPDTISRRIEAAQGRFNPQELFLIIPQGVAPAEQVTASLELFADKVIPRFS